MLRRLGLASGKWNEQGADVKEEVTMYNSIRERKTKAKEGNAGQDRAMKNSREGFVIAREAIPGKVREWLQVYFPIVERLPLLNLILIT
jgi:hypothetical protein